MNMIGDPRGFGHKVYDYTKEDGFYFILDGLFFRKDTARLIDFHKVTEEWVEEWLEREARYILERTGIREVKLTMDDWARLFKSDHKPDQDEFNAWKDAHRLRSAAAKVVAARPSEDDVDYIKKPRRL